MTYPSFETTITIQPGDAEKCVTCPHQIEDPEAITGESWCHVYSTFLHAQEGESENDRCPACLAAEKAARERTYPCGDHRECSECINGEDCETPRPRMLQECPECKGRLTIPVDPAWVIQACPTCRFSPVPGWVEVPR